jgi:CheY-like chemotaxis protein
MKTVLVVEDDDNDLLLMKMACQRTGIPHLLRSVPDGEAAIEYLSGNGVYSDRTIHPQPDLVFLDIRMPKRDGHEVLQWIRSQPRFRTLPVVMLSHSTRAEDVDRAYRLGVTSYLGKLANPAEFGQAVRVILKYWFEVNVAPAPRIEPPAENGHDQPGISRRSLSSTDA